MDPRYRRVTKAGTVSKPIAKREPEKEAYVDNYKALLTTKALLGDVYSYQSLPHVKMSIDCSYDPFMHLSKSCDTRPWANSQVVTTA